LYAAASDGKRYVIISEQILVQRMEICLDLISKFLFEKNNVFKVLVTPEEATIIFTRNAFNTQREYTNHETSHLNVPLLDLRAMHDTLESIREELLLSEDLNLSRPGTPTDEEIFEAEIENAI